jgi:hypothetical protein
MIRVGGTAKTAMIEPRDFPSGRPTLVETRTRRMGMNRAAHYNRYVHNYIAYIIGWMVEKKGKRPID